MLFIFKKFNWFLVPCVSGFIKLILYICYVSQFYCTSMWTVLGILYPYVNYFLQLWNCFQTYYIPMWTVFWHDISLCELFKDAVYCYVKCFQVQYMPMWTIYGTVYLYVNCFQAQCTSALAVLTFCGKSGQAVLNGIVLAYVIAGPIQNIILNTQQVIHVFSCTSSLTYNLTKTRFDLMFRPFAEAVLNMKVNFLQTSQIKVRCAL